MRTAFIDHSDEETIDVTRGLVLSSGREGRRRGKLRWSRRM